MRPATSVRQVNHDFWLDVTKVDTCRFVSMTSLLLQKSICVTQRRGKNIEKLGRRRCSNLCDFRVVFVRLVRHVFCYFIWHVQCRQKPCSFLYRTHLIQNLQLQVLMSKILCNQPPQFCCFVHSPALADRSAVTTTVRAAQQGQRVALPVYSALRSV